MSRPKINVNGKTREMSEKEFTEYLAELERLAASMPPPEATPEELIAQQAQEIAYLREALELILSGVTEVGGNGWT